MYVVMAGLPGSGKSTIARVLKQRLDAVLFDKDAVREFLFGRFTEYSREQDDHCMDVIYSTAGFLIRKQPNLMIILDGRTYSRSYQISAVMEAAGRAETTLRLIECVCSEFSAKERLERSFAEGLHPAADRNFDLYKRSRAGAEPVPEPKLIVDTDNASVEESVLAVQEYLDCNS